MREGAEIAGKTIALAAVVLVVVLIIGAMYLFGFGLFQRGTADFRGGTEQIEKTKGSGDYRIASYDHFFNLCASVQSKEATIDALEKELSRKPDPSESRTEQIYAAITANEAIRAETINQYNVDAKKEATVGQFRASNLPYELNANAKETQCAY